MDRSRTSGSMPQDVSMPKRQPTIALALGGGGARGLGHIPMLEAFDELGIRPKVIAGTSIGAIFGAAYASGMTARAIRAHTEDVLVNRFDLLRELVAARARGFPRFWNMFTARSALLDPMALLNILFPSRMPHDFAGLETPLKIVASDFYAQDPVVFSKGSLRQAVAASMALPVIFQPVVINGRAMIDGGLTNPLPFDLLTGEADIVVAIDVSGAPVPSDKRDHPTSMEALFASAFLFERSIIREKLKLIQPDIYIDAGTSRFQVLDFLKMEEVLKAAEPAKQRLKAQIERVLASETVAAIEDAKVERLALVQEKPKRRLMLRRPGRKPRT